MKNLEGWKLGDAVNELLNWCCPCCHNGPVDMKVKPYTGPWSLVMTYNNGRRQTGAPVFRCDRCHSVLDLGQFLAKYGYGLAMNCGSRNRELRLRRL